MKTEYLIILSLLLVSLFAFFYLSKDEEKYNQYRVANLGAYLYNQLKDNDMSDWKKRCKKCRDGARMDQDACKFCDQVLNKKRDIVEGYGLYFINTLTGKNTGPFSKPFKGIPIRKKKKILTNETDYIPTDDESYEDDSQTLESYCPMEKNNFTFYNDSKKVDYDIPIQKCGGLQPCCTCWPGKPIYGLGL